MLMGPCFTTKPFSQCNLQISFEIIAEEFCKDMSYKISFCELQNLILQGYNVSKHTWVSIFYVNHLDLRLCSVSDRNEVANHSTE